MSDDENPNKRGTLKGQSDGAYKLKLGAVSPTTRGRWRWPAHGRIQLMQCDLPMPGTDSEEP
eukprot:scaffold211034_cov21-Tisochrysis_lutea.AAC.1